MRSLPMLRPTKFLIAITSIGPILAAVILYINVDLWFLPLSFLVTLLFLVVYDMRVGTQIGDIRVHLDTPSLLYMGDEQDLTIKIDTGRAKPNMIVELLIDVNDKLRSPKTMHVHLVSVGIGEVSVRLQPLRRGESEIKHLWLRWQGPLRLTWRVKKEDTNIKIPIVPNLPAVKRAVISLDRLGAWDGTKVQTTRGAGTEFESLREFVNGLDPRDIDWKHTARHRQLISKEFKTEQNHNIVLAIDSGYVMREPINMIPKLDHAINAGLVLAYQALREGDRVGVYGFDSEPRVYCVPQSGRTAYNQIQKALTTLDYNNREANFALGMTNLMKKLRRRSIIIVLTDILDSVSAELMIESVAHLARHHLVMLTTFRDPGLLDTVGKEPDTIANMVHSVVAEDLMRERSEVHEKLKRANVNVLDASPEELNTNLVTRYLKIKQNAMAVR